MSEPQTNVSFRAPAPEKLAPLFPGYEIECLIATGGMGAVYRALQKSLDRKVAIKILPREFSNDTAFCTGFEAEAKAMARLNHPNLIGVYDFGEVDGMLYIVMEYVPGQSLFHSSNGIALESSEVIRLVTGICEGLAHAHEHGILHRDIKPSNILLDLNGQPKIGDFGLARPVDTKIQEGDEIYGTPHYTAPEVVSSPHSVNQRADIFSVGVLLHELLTGRLPSDDRRPASAIVHCDPRFDVIVRRATSVQPENRYHGASEIAKDLHTIAISAGPKVLRTASTNAPAVAARAGYRAKFKKNSGNPAILLLVLAVILAAATLIYRSSEQPASPPAVEDPAAVPENPATIPKPPAPKPEPHPRIEHRPEPDSDIAGHETPEPAPEPEPAQDSDSENTASHGVPASEPSIPEVPTTPKYDVTGFFDRARKIMQERCDPLIASHDKSLGENVVKFEREAKRLIRGIDNRNRRESAEDALKEFVDEANTNGNHLGTKLSKSFDRVDGMSGGLEDYLAKEATIDEILMESLARESSTYILGLEKQAERLDAKDDPVAVSMIAEEITKTRKDPRYFANLMLGVDPEAVKPKDDSP